MRMCDNVSARLCERTNDVADGDNMVSSCSEGGGQNKSLWKLCKCCVIKFKYNGLSFDTFG